MHKFSEITFLYMRHSGMEGYLQYSYTTESLILLTFELNCLQMQNGKRVVSSNSLTVTVDMKVV